MLNMFNNRRVILLFIDPFSSEFACFVGVKIKNKNIGGEWFCIFLLLFYAHTHTLKIEAVSDNEPDANVILSASESEVIYDAIQFAFENSSQHIFFEIFSAILVATQQQRSIFALRSATVVIL